MGLFNILKVWASDAGHKTERSDADIAEGWRDGEAPWSQEWNYQENARDMRINSNTGAADAVSTRPGAATVADLCAGNFSTNQAVNPGSAPNYYNVGARIKDSCIGWDSSTNTPILWVLDGASQLRPLSGCWNTGATPSLGADIGLVFPSTAGGIASVCCDGAFLYVLWWADVSTNLWVSRYPANGATYTTTADWSYDTGQPYETPLIEGEFNARANRIIDTNDGANLGLFFTRTSGAAPYNYVGVLSKDGATYATGMGNQLSDPGPLYSGSLFKVVSDGDHLFWLEGADSGGSRQTALYSADIADPTTSDYTAYTVSVESDGDYIDHPKDLVALNGVVNIATPSGKIYRFSTASDTVRPSLNITNINADISENHGTSLGFDGHNLWLMSRTLQDIETTDTRTFARVPAGLCGSRDGYAAFTIDYPASRITVASYDDYEHGRAGDFEFDGRNLWWVDEHGELLRITNPGGR